MSREICELCVLLSAVFIIDLPTFHNLPLEVIPDWLLHYMLCLNSASGLVVCFWLLFAEWTCLLVYFYFQRQVNRPFAH